MQILHLRTVGIRLVERQLANFGVADGNVESRPKRLQCLFCDLFLIVSDILSFTSLAKTITLHSLCQNHSRCSLVIDGSVIGRIHLDRIVTAATDRLNRLVRQMFNHLQDIRIGSEEVLTDVRAVRNRVLLVLPIDHFTHSLDEFTVFVRVEQRIPVGTPDHFDHIPARATKGCLEFLNNFPVAAYGTVQSLEIAVYDKNQIVQFFAGSQRNSAQCFGLVGFAVAEKRPDFLPGRFAQTTIFKIMNKAGMINCGDRAEAHGDGRELPEVGHQPRMRIGRKPGGIVQFVTKVTKLINGQTAFQKGACINTR